MACPHPYEENVPMAVTHDGARRAQMKAAVEAYFEGIAKKDMSAVPYDDNIVLRSPLTPGGLSTPLVGRQAVFEWFASLWPALGETEVFEHYFNADLTGMALPGSHAAVATRARACCRGTRRRGYGFGRRLHARGS